MSLTAGPGRGYRYYTGHPLFPFGHGLSYTNFSLRLEPPATAPPNTAAAAAVAATDVSPDDEAGETKRGAGDATGWRTECVAMPTAVALRGAPPLAQNYTLTVTNTGLREGTETVQVYFVPPAGMRHAALQNAAAAVGTGPRQAAEAGVGQAVWSAPVPRRRLIDFQKVRLAAGDSVRLVFTVAREQLQMVDNTGARIQVGYGFYSCRWLRGIHSTLPG